ncbi:MAG: NAD-dependent epimerase/dehydratase family protein [Candidatus Acidiferrales bacterium]
MRIAVTGATGFLGRALVRRLLSDNAALQILARPSQKSARLLEDFESRGAKIIPGELHDEDAVARAIKDAEIVYHLAAKVDSSGFPRDFIEANLQGTERILKAALAQKVRRVIYTSSIAVYGLARPGLPIDESTPFDDRPRERDLYAQSKILADQFATAFAGETGLPLTILRPGIIYGPGKPLPIALLGFPAGSTNAIFGNPANRFPLIFIENLIDAMQQAAAADAPQLQQFILLDDDNLTLGAYHAARSAADGTKPLFLPTWPVQLSAAFVDTVRLLFPRSNPALSQHQIQRSLQDRHYSTTHLRKSLNWSPTISLEAALQNCQAVS